MPKTLNPINTFPTSIPNFPLAGNNEPVAIGPLEAAIQAVLNRTESLHQSRLVVEGPGIKRIQRVASLTALENLAGMSDGDVVDVEGYGRYRLYSPSALTADGLWILTATGGGRWVHVLNSMRNLGLATLTSGGRLAQDARDGSILTAHLADAAVNGAKMAAGAAVANLGYTPLNKAGDVVSGQLTISNGNPIEFFGSSNDHRMRLWINTDGRFIMAPYDDGEYQGHREFGYNSGINQWYCETLFNVPGINYSEPIKFHNGGAAQEIYVRKVRASTGWSINDANDPGDGGLFADGQLITHGRAFIHRQFGSNNPAPNISLAIGDSDTGLNWASDGIVNMVANNSVAASWSSAELNVNVPIKGRYDHQRRFTVSGCVGGTGGGTLANGDTSTRQTFAVQLNNQVLRLVRARFWPLTPLKLRVSNTLVWTSSAYGGEFTPDVALCNQTSSTILVYIDLLNDSGASVTIPQAAGWWLEFEIQ